ncbi:MAG: PAS domain S-box protein [Candidatus Binatia bacterium]
MSPVARPLHGVLIAVALTLATAAGVWVLNSATDLPIVLEPFLLPVILSGFLGGLGAGAVAIALSAVLAAFMFPDDLLSVNGLFDWAGLLIGGSLMVGLLHRARTARSLATSREERFATITATAMDGIIILDDAQCVTSFNEAAERMFGITASEILGQRLDRLLPEGMAQRHGRLVEEFGRSGVSRRQLGGAGVLGRRATGEIFPIDLSISQAVVDGRKFYTGILRDVTERVRAERKLRETASQLQLFIDYAPAAIAMFDRDMRYLSASRRWLVDYRLAWPDIVGRSHYEIFPEVPQSWRDIHRRCLEGAVEACEEDCFIRADGTVDWVAWEVQPWFDADQCIGGIMIMSENITARKVAADALRDSEERWRGLVETLPEAMFVNQDDRIVYVNRPAVELWRAKSADELVGRSSLDLIQPESRSAVQELIADRTTSDKVVPLWEARIVALDGTLIPSRPPPGCASRTGTEARRSWCATSVRARRRRRSCASSPSCCAMRAAWRRSAAGRSTSSPATCTGATRCGASSTATRPRRWTSPRALHSRLANRATGLPRLSTPRSREASRGISRSSC